MPVNAVGIVTARDALTIDMDKEALWSRIEDFTQFDPEALRARYALGKDVRDWRVSFAKADVIANFGKKHLVPIAYRPLDTRWTYYTGNSRGFQCYPRHQVMRNFVEHENVGLAFARSNKNPEIDHFYAVASIMECKCAESSTQSGVAPLYLYPEEGTLETERRVNFDPKIYADIRERAGLSGADGDELRVFDYIYGVLHSPDYRATYAQFLKIDFPRIPYPASTDVFSHVAEKGGQLRRLHLMEDAVIGATPYPFSGDGDNVVGKPAFAPVPFVSSADETPMNIAPANGISSSLDANGSALDANGLAVGPNGSGRVHINSNQYFDNVPQLAWEFHIGGYQPAQKWLKDRKGRVLSFDDVLHYQKIIKILTETDRIMKEIELPL